jgi:hypothetical protein
MNAYLCAAQMTALGCRPQNVSAAYQTLTVVGIYVTQWLAALPDCIAYLPEWTVPIS